MAQNLEVIKARFARTFIRFFVDWNNSLDVNINFLEKVRSSRPDHLAKAISSEDRALFKTHVVAAFTGNDKQARQILNSRWDQLMGGVKECIDARIGQEVKVDDLARPSLAFLTKTPRLL
ncbi:unnamed protein product [Penicillium manginii]